LEHPGAEGKLTFIWDLEEQIDVLAELISSKMWSDTFPWKHMSA